MARNILFLLCVMCLSACISNLTVPQQFQMDKQAVSSILRYSPQSQQLRGAMLTPRPLEAIRASSRQSIHNEFRVLDSIDVADEYFNKKNKNMNRYIDILAYEHSRVRLPDLKDYYINANEMRSVVDGNIYGIFSQAPVEPFDNFWEAVYYKNVTTVVMLCSFYDPKRGNQAEQYWPDQGYQQSFFEGKLKVTAAQTKQVSDDYIVRTFVIDGPEGPKSLTHLHWMGWADLQRPLEGNMDTFEEIISTCLQSIEDKKLIWIHCSAGIGRTGTLGGVIEAIRYYKQNKAISIFMVVQNMRRYRYHAVQTFEQYLFLYQYLGKKLG